MFWWQSSFTVASIAEMPRTTCFSATIIVCTVVCYSSVNQKRSKIKLVESEDNVRVQDQFDKPSSARSIPFVLSEISMRNFWARRLLWKSLDRDLLVKKSARELAMLACKPFSEQTKCVMNSRKRGVVMLIKRLQYFRRLLVFANLPLFSLLWAFNHV